MFYLVNILLSRFLLILERHGADLSRTYKARHLMGTSVPWRPVAPQF